MLTETLIIPVRVRVTWEPDTPKAKAHAMRRARQLVRAGGSKVVGAVDGGWYTAKVLGLVGRKRT